jgi:hypothetical protein
VTLLLAKRTVERSGATRPAVTREEPSYFFLVVFFVVFLAFLAFFAMCLSPPFFDLANPILTYQIVNRFLIR